MSEDSGAGRAVSARQLSDEVASYVRELIMSGRLRSGDFIRQERIAEELELSATPVREGLLSLKGEGFVLLKPRRGSSLPPVGSRYPGLVYGSGFAGRRTCRSCRRPDEPGRPA